MGKYDDPCVYYSAAEDAVCGAAPTRMFMQGPLCRGHAPEMPPPPPAPLVDGVVLGSQRQNRPLPDDVAERQIRDWNEGVYRRTKP